MRVTDHISSNRLPIGDQMTIMDMSRTEMEKKLPESSYIFKTTSSFRLYRMLAKKIINNNNAEPTFEGRPSLTGRAALNWVSCGMPVFEVGAKRAAVLASTVCSNELLDSIIEPFQTFAIHSDSSFGRSSHGELEGFLLVSRWSNDSWSVISKVNDTDIEVVAEGCKTESLISGMFQLHFASLGESRSDMQTNDNDRRLASVIGRMIVGLILSLDHKGECLGTSKRSVKEDITRHLSGYEQYRFTGSVPIDVRTSVSEFIKSGSGAPLVRMLIRGHWKLQPCGPGRVDRKPVHILPYWRGPVDGPLAIRHNK